MTARELYDRDFFRWTVHNAELLRAGRLDHADIEHIAEEIEDMGKSQQREMENRLCVLLMHLLKWQAQPERRGRSWEATIRAQRLDLSRLLKKMPSLCPQLPGAAEEVYRQAVYEAIAETSLPKTSFPESCPFSIDQILDDEFFPG